MMKQARINIICDYASIYGGNFIPSILSLSKALLKHDCFVLLTFPETAKDRNWVKYLLNNSLDICFVSFSNKVFKKEIKSINKKHKINIIYSHFVSGLKIKLLYPFSKKNNIFIHVHSDFGGGQKKNLYLRIKDFLEHKILRTDSKYIFVSEEMKNHYNNKNCLYIPNALSLDRVPCEKVDTEVIKKQYLIGDKDTVFLMFGWSPFIKGTDIAVKSFINACKKNDNAKLIIVYGKGDGYKTCTSFLKERLGDEFLNDKRIIFLPPSEDVCSYYNLSDVFISSSRSEGFSYSILESLYYNLRVISSDIPGVKWAKKYQSVSFYEKECIDECTKIIKSSIGFKKKDGINNDLLIDYNINEWSNTISNILLNDL